MLRKSGYIFWGYVSLILLLTTGCSGSVQAGISSPSPIIYRTQAESDILSPVPSTSSTNTPTVTASPTFTPSPAPPPSATPFPTDDPTPTSVPTLSWYPPGDIVAPILLYHHVADDGNGIRYFVTQANFRAQMKALHDWGYKSITTSTLARVITTGGELPDRRVVISFDDGYSDVFQNAFPIMQEYGFIGTIYIYVDKIDSRAFMSTDEILTLLASGWEVGSHSMSHPDLTKNPSIVEYEVQQSRDTLEQLTGTRVYSFAYPYGELNDNVIRQVQGAGYLAGMGLGLNYHHSLDTLFDLKRIEIYAGYTFDEFKKLLPWSDQ